MVASKLKGKKMSARLFVMTAIEADQKEVKEVFSSVDFQFIVESVQYIQNMVQGNDEDDFNQASDILAKLYDLRG